MSIPLAARLDALWSLAEVGEAAAPLGLNSIVMTGEGVLGISRPPQPSKLHFIADELPFNVAVTPDGDEAVCQMWAEVGHIPFSAHDPIRRRRILDILRGIPPLPFARFVVERGQKILLFSETRVAGHVTPEDMAWQTVETLRDARPFLRLLGEWL